MKKRKKEKEADRQLTESWKDTSSCLYMLGINVCMCLCVSVCIVVCVCVRVHISRLHGNMG